MITPRSASPMKHDSKPTSPMSLSPPLSPQPISSSDTFHSVQSTFSSRTLVGSVQESATLVGSSVHDDEETTLADSVVDSMHTCVDETLVESEKTPLLKGAAGGGEETDVEEDFLFEDQVRDTPTPEAQAIQHGIY